MERGREGGGRMRVIIVSYNGGPAHNAAKLTHIVGDVIDHNCSLCSSVVHWCKAVVAFLPGRVPDLKLYCCVV